MISSRSGNTGNQVKYVIPDWKKSASAGVESMS